MAKKTVRLPSWPKSPSLTNITSLSTLVLTPPWNYTMTEPKGDKREALERFLGTPLPKELDAHSFGNLEDLVDTHHNVALASLVLDTMLVDLLQVCKQRDVPPNPRLLVSARLIPLGVSKVTSAHVLHVRSHKFYQASALALTRTGIELIGRGGWVAIRTGDEPHRVTEGHKLPKKTRREIERTMGASACLVAIEDQVRKRWSGADAPKKVYEWLCRFTHFDGSVVEQLAADRGQLREDAYAATAYVAWLGATMAGIVIGQSGAKTPRLPAPGPWSK